MDVESENELKNKINSTEDAWVLIESYFRNQHLKQLIRHQIESYNYFYNLERISQL